VFENRLLRNIGRKRDEVTGDWRTPHDEELYDVFLTKYYSGDQIRKNWMGGGCSRYWREERCVEGFRGET